MATVRKRGDRYYAEICVAGVRQGKSFDTEQEAESWGLTLADLLDKYVRTYSVHKPSRRSEEKRSQRLSADLGHLRLDSLAPGPFAQWRDARLLSCKTETVRRDWALLHHALSVAVEWGWIPANPLAAIRRPKRGKPRTQVWSQEATRAYLSACGHPGDTLTARTGDVLLFSLETAMRPGEICRVRPEDVHNRWLHIPRTKNGHARDVPLSAAACDILAGVDNHFGITERQLDVLFRKVKKRIGLELQLRDARRTALTRLAKKFDTLSLARISGHRDLRVLLNTYYAPSIQDLIDRID